MTVDNADEESSNEYTGVYTPEQGEEVKKVIHSITVDLVPPK